MASRRRGAGGRRAKARRQQKVNRQVSQRRADRNRGIAAARASGQRRRSEPQYLTGRDAAARGIATANREKDLQQSVGSLDRRVEKALKEGNTGLAKDLRSRQNKFARELAYERARNTPGGTIKGARTSGGNPILTSKGFDVFQQTRDQDFIDPTRKLQNEFPDQFGEMYPITNILNRGPFAFQGIQAALGKERKPIPYNLEDMPGIRYPLDPIAVRTRSDRQAPLDEKAFTVSDRQPGFRDTDPQLSIEFGETTPEDLILPKQFDVIDPDTRSEVVDETMGDIIDSGVQDFAELDKEFQKESAEYEKRKAEEPTFTDNYPFEVASNEPIRSYFNLFGQNDAPDDQILVDALNADMLDDGTFQSVTNPTMEEPQMQLSPIPVEDFLPEMNRQMEEDKFRLKADFPYLNDAQIEGLYNYKKGIGSKTPTSLDSNPVEFDDYMIKRMF